MTMLYCRHCGGQVDETATTCPHCAAVQDKTAIGTAAQDGQADNGAGEDNADRPWSLLGRSGAFLAALILLSYVCIAEDEPDHANTTHLIWASFLLLPPLAFLIRRKAAVAVHRQLLMANGALLVMVPVVYGLANANAISFVRFSANFIGLPLVYFACCYLVASCQQTTLRRLLTVPLVLGGLLGPISTTILLVVFGNGIDPPKVERRVEPNISYKSIPWGWAGGDSGYDIHRYKTLDFLPFLEQEEDNYRVTETEEP